MKQGKIGGIYGMLVFMDDGYDRIILRFLLAAERTGSPFGHTFQGLRYPPEVLPEGMAETFYSMGLSAEIGSDFNEK